MSWYNNNNDNDDERPNGMSPRRARGGIQARSQRGDFARNWWARRWISAMERLVDVRRLARGRHYARSGQVLSMEEAQGGIQARVQGSRPSPYRVSIRITPLKPDQWEKVLDELAEQAIFAAQLLAGEMPADIEQVFSAAGVSLFPDRLADLQTECTCPDWANPCKHVAATHYILGERFDEDPFLILRLRGRTQDQILAALRERRAGASTTPAGEEHHPYLPADNIPTLEEELPNFWEIGSAMQGFAVQVRPPTLPQPVLQRLGEPDVNSPIRLREQLQETYEAISAAAISLAFGDFGPGESGEENA